MNDDQRQPAPQQGGGLYDGATATNPQTGARIVYRINPSGKGRWMQMTADTAPPDVRERYNSMQSMADIGRRTEGLARQFVDLNTQAQTGGWQNDPNLPEFMRPENAQRLSALSSQMTGANWQPGTTGMFNTATEQQMMARRFPTPTNRGDVNLNVYLSMAEEVAAQRAAATDMRTWLQSHPSLDGWEEAFRAREPQIRAQARQQAHQEFANRNRGRIRRPGSPAQQSAPQEIDLD